MPALLFPILQGNNMVTIGHSLSCLINSLPSCARFYCRSNGLVPDLAYQVDFTAGNSWVSLLIPRWSSVSSGDVLYASLLVAGIYNGKPQLLFKRAVGKQQLAVQRDGNNIKFRRHCA